jgi:biopolymer transport protein ExbD
MKLLSPIDIETSEAVDINLSPLIDMVFLLLIFFMVTAVFVQETGIEVRKPVAASSQALARDSILLAVTEAGQIYYGGRQIALNSVRGVVARQLRSDQLPVIVLADEHSQTGTLVQVIDQCKLAGATNVSVATQPPK